MGKEEKLTHRAISMDDLTFWGILTKYVLQRTPLTPHQQEEAPSPTPCNCSQPCHHCRDKIPDIASGWCQFCNCSMPPYHQYQGGTAMSPRWGSLHQTLTRWEISWKWSSSWRLLVCCGSAISNWQRFLS